MIEKKIDMFLGESPLSTQNWMMRRINDCKKAIQGLEDDAKKMDRNGVVAGAGAIKAMMEDIMNAAKHGK